VIKPRPGAGRVLHRTRDRTPERCASALHWADADSLVMTGAGGFLLMDASHEHLAGAVLSVPGQRGAARSRHHQADLVTLNRLDKAGLIAAEQEPSLTGRPDRKGYAPTAAGQRRVSDWLAGVIRPKPDLAEFRLKLIAAAAFHLMDELTAVASWKDRARPRRRASR
jgi:Transcriptional regulator PadR-like family